MSLRGVLAVLVLVGVLGAGWQQRERLQGWVTSASLPQWPAAPGGAASGPSASAKVAEPGGLRKCVKGGQVTYANVECPAGSQAQAVSGGTVSVVPATPVPKPSEAASGPTALHRALDITRDDTLRDKIMQRQIEGPR